MKITITLFLLSIANFSFAQKKQNVYFLGEDGKVVTNKDSVAFVRIIEEPDSGETNFIFKEFYRNNIKKTLGSVSSFSPNLIFEGSLIEFYKSGKKKSIENYTNNVLVGSAYYYYPNGKFQEERAYPSGASERINNRTFGQLNKTKNSDLERLKDRVLPKRNEYNPLPDLVNYKTIQYADSNGTEFLDKNSTGQVQIGSESTDNIIGNYLNGFKEGEWKEYVKKDSVNYIETFKSGKFIEGKRIASDGSIQTYNRLEILPTFKGGMENFYRFLGSEISYPSQARKNNIAGKVFLKFVVDKDGSLVDVKVVKGLGYGCDEEAVRAVESSPKWTTALMRGKAVRVKFNIAVNFNLTNSPPQDPNVHSGFGNF